MKRYSTISLLLIAAGFLVFSLFNNLLMSSARVDLTENRLYTLSDGTREVIAEIEEPINLYFFFSSKLSEDLTSLRAYAQRVEEMLEEYSLVAGGNIRLEVIDPEPFSEQEDRAAAYGLQGVPVNQAGDQLYFGLAGTNALDGQEVIEFFNPEKESFLEYELSKLIANLGRAEKPTVMIYSGLEIDGGFDQMSMQPREAWVFLDQLRELFDVEMLSDLTMELDPARLLILIHPKDLSDSQLLAVDQHVMKGGRLMAFVDPMAEMDQPADPRAGMAMGMPGETSSDLNRLSSSWGVSLRENEVLADAEIALMVGGPGGMPVRHLGILGFVQQQLAADNSATADLETINMSTAGAFSIDEVDGITAEVLVQSSQSAAMLPAMQFQFMSNPEDLQKGFTPSGESFPVAVRLSGSAATAFPDGLTDVDAELVKGTDALQVLLVADSDWLADRLWVQVQSFFGQQFASAFADNGTLVTNLVEQFSGNSALIDVRSRGQFTRPFSVVQDLRLSAEAQYLQSAEDLQAQLQETERQLSELQASQVEDGLLTLSPEQEAALDEFQEEKLRIRKELRDVRHQLDSEIESLGGMLKLLNILIMPLLLTGLLLMIRFLGLYRRGDAA